MPIIGGETENSRPKESFMATQGSIIITTNNTAFSIYMPSHAGPKSTGKRIKKVIESINPAVLEDKADMVKIVDSQEHITPEHKDQLKSQTQNSKRYKKYEKWVEHLHGDLKQVLDTGIYVEISPYIKDNIDWVYHINIPNKVVSTIKNTPEESWITEEYPIEKKAPV